MYYMFSFYKFTSNCPDFCSVEQDVICMFDFETVGGNPRYLIIQYRKAVYCGSAYNTLPPVLCAKFVSVPGGDISSHRPPRHDGHSLNTIPKSLG